MSTVVPAPPGTFWQAYRRTEDGDAIREPVFVAAPMGSAD